MDVALVIWKAVVWMHEYYGKECLDRIFNYYRGRYLQAEERDFNTEESKYFWLYSELRVRLLIIRQAICFIEALPKFMGETSDEQTFQYTTTYVNSLFRPELTGELKRDDADVHPFFNSANPYWVQMNEVLDDMGEDYDTTILPLVYIDLCEYVVRSVRLLLQIREMTIAAVDREKFDVVMELEGPSS